ncbi:MAG: hypothetical protein JWP55_1135 [Mycobacterium sp.]|nr:hypothetical protein [Mycobacterium sp.]
MASKLGPASESPSSSNGAETVDLASVLAALGTPQTPVEEQQRTARANRRGLLTLALIGLILGGVIQLATSTPQRERTASSGESRADVVFGNAHSGTCLGWPPDEPDKPSFVQCAGDHMFEVIKPVPMNNFGEPCQLAAREYLGSRYDPSSRFTISVIWPGDAVGTPASERNLLCGLQLLGPGGRAIPFKGKIAELDQSRVWPPGTCIGIDVATRRSTDMPADCSSPHALEVAGAANLAERFPDGFPAESEQLAFLADVCTHTADAYLAPMTLQAAGVAVHYDTVSPASWAAGSRQVSCSIGTPADGGWASKVGSTRVQPLVDGPAPAPPPPSPPSEPPREEPAPAESRTQTPSANTPPPSSAPSAPSTAAPSTNAAPPPVYTTPPAALPTTVTTAAPPPGSPPPGAPLPGPPPTSTEQPGVVEIPGMAPITLPWMVPPPPPEPPPPAPAPGA